MNGVKFGKFKFELLINRIEEFTFIIIADYFLKVFVSDYIFPFARKEVFTLQYELVKKHISDELLPLLAQLQITKKTSTGFFPKGSLDTP
jgi:hypothetical protein